jgi:hypothetical protein
VGKPTSYSDTETTSLIDPHLPGGRRVWESAIIRLSPDRLTCQASWLQIIDVDLSDADPDSLAIGRFEERWSDVEGPRGVFGQLGQLGEVELLGVTEAQAADIIDELTKDGAVIAGSNPGFDQASYADLLRRHGREPSWYHHPRDIPNVAHGWLLGRDAEAWQDASYSTEVLSKGCAVRVPTDRHSAWADTAWVMRWDERLTATSTRPNGGVRGTLLA